MSPLIVGFVSLDVLFGFDCIFDFGVLHTVGFTIVEICLFELCFVLAASTCC